MSAGRGMGANDAVLVAAGADWPSLQRPQAPAGEMGGASRCGGSGFVWNGLVLTSATWLANILTLRHTHFSDPDSRPGPSPGSIPTAIEWELTEPKTAFHVIYQTMPDHKRTTKGPTMTKSTTKCPNSKQWSSSGLAVREAKVESVVLLRDVYHCLAGQLQGMDQWRSELPARDREGGGGGREEVVERERGEDGAVGELVSLESLLLPLSCVVLLRVGGLCSAMGLPRSAISHLPALHLLPR